MFHKTEIKKHSKTHMRAAKCSYFKFDTARATYTPKIVDMGIMLSSILNSAEGNDLKTCGGTHKVKEYFEKCLTCPPTSSRQFYDLICGGK